MTHSNDCTPSFLPHPYLVSYTSSMYNWSTATSRGKPCKWRQSGSMHRQWVGYCLWWFLEYQWCCCGVSPVGLLHSRLVACITFTGNWVKTIWPTGAVAFSSAHFGAGIGPIYLDDVDCTGSESNLIECSRSSNVTCTSGHSQDAGVRCQGKNNSM